MKDFASVSYERSFGVLQRDELTRRFGPYIRSQLLNETMKKLDAYSVSIGVMAVVDTYLTATIIPVPVWVTFIAWASFFILGGKISGLKQSIASNLTGVVISSLTLLTITELGSHPIVAAVCVGIGSAAMVQVSKLPLLSAIPAIVWGFASTVGTTVATGKPITTISLANSAVVAGTAMVLGGIFGYLSEIWGDALCGERKPVASKSAAGGTTS